MSQSINNYNTIEAMKDRNFDKVELEIFEKDKSGIFFNPGNFYKLFGSKDDQKMKEEDFSQPSIASDIEPIDSQNS